MSSLFPSGRRCQREDLKKGASILKGPQGYHCDPTGKNKECVSMLLRFRRGSHGKERKREGEGEEEEEAIPVPIVVQ
jgi:hypothetical protein